MTTYSQSELGLWVLRTPGLLGAEETPTASDLTWAQEVAASEIGMMASIGLPIWNGSDVSVPLEYMSILSRRIALAITPSFGLSDLATSQLAMREAERYLTIMAAPRVQPLTMRADDAKRGGTSFNFTTGR